MTSVDATDVQRELAAVRRGFEALPERCAGIAMMRVLAQAVDGPLGGPAARELAAASCTTFFTSHGTCSSNAVLPIRLALYIGGIQRGNRESHLDEPQRRDQGHYHTDRCADELPKTND